MRRIKLTEAIDLQKQFKVSKNEDAKRWEFKSVNDNSVSYTVGFHEAEDEADAYIAVWKAIQKELPSQKEATNQRHRNSNLK